MQNISMKWAGDKMPNDSFTFLSPASDTTSWIDHIFVAESLYNNISDIEIHYDIAIDDHFPMSFSLEVSTTEALTTNTATNLAYVKWHKMQKKDFLEYTSNVDYYMNNILRYEKESLMCTKFNCKNENHLDEIKNIFKLIKNTLLENTRNFEFEQERAYKPVPGWNDLVKTLHKKARHCLLTWINSGKPKTGSIYADMKESKKKFKRRLKTVRNQETKIRKENLLNAHKQKNKQQFWKNIRYIKTKNDYKVNRIDGETDLKKIAESFKLKYKKILSCDSAEDHSNARNISAEDIPTRYTLVKCISYEETLAAIGQLKPGIGPDRIHTNHLQHAPLSLVKLLSDLFVACVTHVYMPSEALNGVIQPLIKDYQKDQYASSNYRPVMNSSIIFKVFEYIIKAKIENKIKISDFQHGFRKRYSTATACTTLKETVSSYVRNKSSVFVCFMDLSKAFDKVNHDILIDKLCKLKIPMHIISIINYIYRNQNVAVNFRENISGSFKVTNGLRQGAILSPIFFNIYINDVLNYISGLNDGCKLGMMSANTIAYADDVTLLAPTTKGLQLLIDVFVRELNKLKLLINKEKSVIMIFGSGNVKGSFTHIFRLNNANLQIVTSFKYLGFQIRSNLSDVDDIIKCRKKFYNEFNSLIRKFPSVDTEVLSTLFDSYCGCFYGSELWINTIGCKTVLKEFEVGYHKAMKKIHKLKWWDSNHDLFNKLNVFLFKHKIFYDKLMYVHKILSEPCKLFKKNMYFYNYLSISVNDVYKTLLNDYSVISILDNDKQALKSRIMFVQCREKDQVHGNFFLN
jgi:hypothetical protein